MFFKLSVSKVFFFLISLTFGTDLTTPQLSPSQQKELDSLAQSFHVAACDSLPLAECLDSKHPCPMAVHLKPFARWLVSKGKALDSCLKDCSARSECVTAATRFKIDLADVPIAGDRRAPVSIVIYISVLCPLCKYLTSEMYHEVTAGALKGKASLVAKPFTAGPGDRALMAAGQLKKYWEYICALQKIKIRPDDPVLLKIADSLKLPQTEFIDLLADGSTMQKLHEFREEGERNGVTLTPTVFINGKRYRSYKDPQWVIDAALYEYEQGPKTAH
jgi:predicted DsbA family dithiol-disulfide isomerase